MPGTEQEPYKVQAAMKLFCSMQKAAIAAKFLWLVQAGAP